MLKTAQAYLIKAAMRLGERIRLGLVSDTAQQRMEQANVLRPPEQIATGLNRGSVNLMHKHNINEIMPNVTTLSAGDVPAPYLSTIMSSKVPRQTKARLQRAHAMMQQVAGKRLSLEEVREAMKPTPDMLEQINLMSRIYGKDPKMIISQPASKLFPKIFGREIPQDQTKQLAALFRRHEVNEQIAMTQMMNQSKNPMRVVSNASKNVSVTGGHAAPRGDINRIIRLEGQDAAMLSPGVRDTMRGLRGGRDLTRILRQRKGTLANMGTYANWKPPVQKITESVLTPAQAARAMKTFGSKAPAAAAAATVAKKTMKVPVTAAAVANKALKRT